MSCDALAMTERNDYLRSFCPKEGPFLHFPSFPSSTTIMPDSSTLAGQYFAAAKLNNIAVNLLELRCLSEAAKVTNNGLKVLREVGTLRASEVDHMVYRASLYLNTDPEDETSYAEDCDFGSQECDDRLLGSLVRTNQRRRPSVDQSESKRFLILNQNGNPPRKSSHTNIRNQESDKKRKQVFYIEQKHLSKSVPEAETKMILALMMHNQGQIYRALADSRRYNNGGSSTKSFQQGAIRFFELSRSLLLDLRAETMVPPMIVVAMHQTNMEMQLVAEQFNTSLVTPKKEAVDSIPRRPSSSSMKMQSVAEQSLLPSKKEAMDFIPRRPTSSSSRQGDKMIQPPPSPRASRAA